MPKVLLTDNKVKNLKPAPAGKRYDIMDAAVPGFGIRVTDKGVKTFVLVARYPGSSNPTRRALGEYLGEDEAKDVDEGEPPPSPRRARRPGHGIS